MNLTRLTRLIGLLALPWIPVCLSAQSRDIDSLRNELTKSQLHDSTRASICNRLTSAFLNVNTDEAIAYGLKSVEMYKQLGDREQIASASGELGTAYKNKGELDKAIEVLKTGIGYVENSGSLVLGDLYHNIGSVYYRIPDYNAAIYYYLQALKVFEALSPDNARLPQSIGKTYNNLGTVYCHQKDYLSALKYYKLSLERWPSPSVYNNIAQIYDEHGSYDSAAITYRKAIDLARQQGEHAVCALVLANLGSLFRKETKFDSSEYYLKAALTIADTISVVDTEAYIANEFARLCFDKKDYKKAICYGRDALKLSVEANSNEERMGSLRLLSQAYSTTGDFQKANRYLEEYTQLRDSIFTMENITNMATLQKSYEIEKRQNEISQLAQKNEVHRLKIAREANLRNFLILLIALLVIIVILVIYNLRVKSRSLKTKSELITRLSLQSKEILLQNNRIKSMNQVLEMKTLRAQVNPHFLFNALSSIQNYIVRSDKEMAIDYLQKFTRLMRKILDSSMVLSITLKEEREMLSNYIELERLRFNFSFDYEIVISDDLEADSVTIPYLLTQPYVENAILHGLRIKDEKGFLRIEFKRENQRLLCVVDDNGIGRKASHALRKPVRHKSVGIALTEDRIRKVGEYTNEKVEVKIIDKEEFGHAAGTRVEMLIPLTFLDTPELYQYQE